MTTKNQLASLRRQAGTIRNQLRKERSRYSPVSEKYHRIEAILETADRLHQGLKEAEKGEG